MAANTVIKFPPTLHTHEMSELLANGTPIIMKKEDSAKPDSASIIYFPHTIQTIGVLFGDGYTYIYNDGTNRNIWFRYSNDPSSNSNPKPEYISIADIAKRLAALEAKI